MTSFACTQVAQLSVEALPIDRWHDRITGEDLRHGRFLSFADVQSKASVASAPARVQSIIKHVHVTCFVHKGMLGVIAQPSIPAVLLCQEVSKKMATCIDKLASGVNLCLSLTDKACAVQR